ncbi:catechol 2,3-dioxygenase [Ktedonosporobacter rubrisoli]|uniref:Catechol 2,3-dioxygenase n=1 Tax=Ktedonosporobacter rubrisoli TaxID=2509675 RepID=A0A4P6JNW0_KTERU|nr:catechol 2,3-dioxygenase [Ktedonosporobacter rubrisoli]QBD77027.1 catechol 2,3-dioxygenase [Ktedonosporobacter rubrisoli]
MQDAHEPIRDIAHLGHVELLTPKPAESAWFFKEILGMEETDCQGQSIYLRAWGDYDHCTLKLTEAPQAGLGHVGWRTMSPQALERRARRLAELGYGKQWIEGDIGHGRAYQFEDADGHFMEIYYESQKYKAAPHMSSKLINQPQRYTGRGIGTKRIDHVNLMCSDVTLNRIFLQENLGFQLRECLQPEVDGIEEGAWLSVTPLVHDIAYTRDFTGNHGRLHHVAYWLDNREEILRAADLLIENDIFLEAGPAKHNITQAFYIYLYEPGGNRVELFSGGYLIFAPDWEPVIWRKAERGRGVYWGGTLPTSFRTYGTPVRAEPQSVQEERPLTFDPI